MFVFNAVKDFMQYHMVRVHIFVDFVRFLIVGKLLIFIYVMFKMLIRI